MALLSSATNLVTVLATCLVILTGWTMSGSQMARWMDPV